MWRTEAEVEGGKREMDVSKRRKQKRENLQKKKKSVLKDKGGDQEDHSLGVFSNPMETC